MTAHAKLSASGSARWLNCAGSVAAEATIPSANKGGFYASEGSTAHELADICLTEGKSPFDFEGQTLPENNAVTVDREMCNAVQDYMDYVATVPGVHEYEQRVDFSDWVPEGFGTSDVISVDGDTIYIVDLKYGKGVRVDAEDNTQMMLYALGAYSEQSLLHELKTVKMAIVQPRLDHISEATITVEALLKWAEWVAERAEEAISKDAERTPGEKQCQWCAAKATCPALDAYTRRIVSADFDDLSNPDTLPDDRVREVLDAKKLITGWLDAVEKHVVERLESGQDFPGYKLVAGRSLRQWEDEKTAETKLVELLDTDAYERKLLTPAKAEKVLGKKKAVEIADLIVKPEGKPTLAPESDKRPAVNVTANDFEACKT
ncbi:MAG TPA: DUF2800 domain-containing protein [Orrella sp.]